MAFVMRLWLIHPKYLDAKGLVALWREGLLAQKVLQGKTKGYTAHPQLIPFKKCINPLAAINTYLSHIYQESLRRGYHFDKRKIGMECFHDKMSVTKGQLLDEFGHLMGKLKLRDSEMHQRLLGISTPQPHPLFTVINGDREE
jgi:hypothetical protein